MKYEMTFSRGASRTHPARRRIVGPMFWLAGLTVLLSGCGREGPPRVAVEGEVSFDGKPLAKGSILFLPTSGTQGPQVGGKIEDGRFRIPRGQGPVIGKLRVEIRAEQDLGYDITEPEEFAPHSKKRLPKNPIPAVYNDRSTLVRETTSDGPNKFDFKLETKK